MFKEQFLRDQLVLSNKECHYRQWPQARFICTLWHKMFVQGGFLHSFLLIYQSNLTKFNDIIDQTDELFCFVFCINQQLLSFHLIHKIISRMTWSDKRNSWSISTRGGHDQLMIDNWSLRLLLITWNSNNLILVSKRLCCVVWVLKQCSEFPYVAAMRHLNSGGRYLTSFMKQRKQKYSAAYELQ